MTWAVIPGQDAAIEPLYDVDLRTGATVEVFYASGALAKSFNVRPGWYWRKWRGGSFSDTPVGPFASRYSAYRNVASRWQATRPKNFGKSNEV